MHATNIIPKISLPHSKPQFSYKMLPRVLSVCILIGSFRCVVLWCPHRGIHHNPELINCTNPHASEPQVASDPSLLEPTGSELEPTFRSPGRELEGSKLFITLSLSPPPSSLSLLSLSLSSPRRCENEEILSSSLLLGIELSSSSGAQQMRRLHEFEAV